MHFTNLCGLWRAELLYEFNLLINKSDWSCECARNPQNFHSIMLEVGFRFFTANTCLNFEIVDGSFIPLSRCGNKIGAIFYTLRNRFDHQLHAVDARDVLSAPQHIILFFGNIFHYFR